MGADRDRPWVRRAAVSAAAALALAAPAGCALVGPRGAEAATCVSWVWFETPEDALSAVDLAVRTEGGAGARVATGSVDLLGVPAAVHRIRVADVLVGDGARPGDQLDVVSTPVTCAGGGAYPDGDPLDAPGELVLLLHHDEDAGVWRTLTPEQGAVRASPDGSLPRGWPAASTAG